MADAIRALQPGYVIIETVPGIATKMGSRPGESALGTVVADLAEAGYVGSWIRLRASDVGAPHKRERVFITASNPERLRVDAGAGLRRRGARESDRSSQEAVSAGAQVARAEDAVTDGATPADTERDSERWPRSGEVPGETGARTGEGPERERLRADLGDGSEAAADSERERFQWSGEGDEGGEAEERYG